MGHYLISELSRPETWRYLIPRRSHSINHSQCQMIWTLFGMYTFVKLLLNQSPQYMKVSLSELSDLCEYIVVLLEGGSEFKGFWLPKLNYTWGIFSSLKNNLNANHIIWNHGISPFSSVNFCFQGLFPFPSVLTELLFQLVRFFSFPVHLKGSSLWALVKEVLFTAINFISSGEPKLLPLPKFLPGKEVDNWWSTSVGVINYLMISTTHL